MRLIDEQTTNELVRKVLRKYGFADDSVVSDEIWDTIENEVPTAYDLEKIVEKLDKEAQCLYSIHNFSPIKAWQNESLLPIIIDGNDIEIPTQMEIPEIDLEDE